MDGRRGGDGLRDAFADLVTGSHCAGCARPGRIWCRACDAALTATPFVACPTPAPPHLGRVVAATSYAAPVAGMIVGHKERRQLGLRRPLGRLLALAVGEVVPAPAPVLLVPVPSRPMVVRRRGHDPTPALARAAARLLTAQGYDARCAPLLVSRGGVRDQGGLDAAARADNLAGSLACPAPRLRRWAASRPHAHVVICDDVITTGATLGEAHRALAATGVVVTGAATVAATMRRHPGPGSSIGPRTGSTSPERLSSGDPID